MLVRRVFADEDPVYPSITNRVGLMIINASGAVTGIQLDSSVTGLQTQAVNRTLNIDDAAGPGTGNVGPNTFAVTDGGKTFFIDAANKTPPSITVVEHQ